MKKNRVVRENQILYSEMTHGLVTHVVATHIPSGYTGKATKQGSRLSARYEARNDLQAKLDAYWLP